MLLMHDRTNKLWSPYAYILYIHIDARVVFVVVVYLTTLVIFYVCWTVHQS